MSRLWLAPVAERAAHLVDHVFCLRQNNRTDLLVGK